MGLGAVNAAHKNRMVGGVGGRKKHFYDSYVRAH